MSSLGIKWTVETIEIKDLDLSDNTFQTRVNVSTVDDKVVNEYVEDIKRKEAFPMLVVKKTKSGRYAIVCGRHRGKGYTKAQNGVARIVVYVVDDGCSEVALKSLSVRDNNGNGVRQSKSENISVAVDLLTAQQPAPGCISHTRDDILIVAKKFRLNITTLTNHYRAKLVQAELRGMGLPLEKFCVTTCRELWAFLATNKEDFCSIAKAIASCNVPNASELISASKKQHATAAEIVRRILLHNDLEKKPASFERHNAGRVGVLIEHLGLALNDLEFVAKNSQQISDEQFEEILSLAISIGKVASRMGRNQ